ncbi:MAG: Slam-dependent surface lipoprotein [Marinobacter sp.]|uniref:Slam-dependent surface lipoprotein n=1 Tax=Marinobacter sp. TaxID=50741 RepID=UPI003F96BFC6
MKKSTLTLAIMALVGSGAAFAASPNVQGGSSDTSGVETGKSDHSLFKGNNSGVALNGASSYIDLAGGPVNGSNNAIDDHGNGAIMTPADMGLFGGLSVAQVWKADASVNGGGSTYANFAINSVRQITTLSFAPQFGGLVIGQVGANSTGSAADPAVPLSVGNGVYFGEWAPRATGTPPQDSTDLNMASNDRTVWYVGDNAVDTMPTAVNATYSVVGINGVGTTAGGSPDNPNLYSGTLTASYSSGSGSLSGSIDRGTDTVDFTGTNIRNDGTFDKGTTIEGRFYNGAEALAGIHKAGAGVADDVAFGGSKISGTITP